MEPVADRAVWPVLISLAECLCQQITDSGLPEPCFCGIYPGQQVPFDYCDGCEDGKCGQAWVRLSQTYLSKIFPAPDPEGTCIAPLAFVVEVGIIRCAPVADENGNPPSMADQLDTALLQVNDMMAMRRAIMCCTQAFKHRRHVLQNYTPVGPLGGCVGGGWLVVFSGEEY